MKKKLFLIPLAAIALLGLPLGAVTFEQIPKAKTRIMPNDPDQILSFNKAIVLAKDSIVYISTTQSVKEKYMQKMNPLLERFFGQGMNPHGNPHRQSLGSGVIVTTDGYIVTNNHVVDDAESIMVKIPGSDKEYTAKLIGADPKSDIAVIKIDAKELSPIKMGDASSMKMGDVVFAIGNPFGVGLSVSQGIISAQHKDSIGINEYENFIQTDASINPGNSGGALVDSRGALIGINSAIITRSGGNNGIGFAIEVGMVENIAKKLIESGSVERGYLGVSIGDMTKEIKKLYSHQKGALLIDVLKDSPAAEAGLRRGDLITSLDGKRVKNAAELKNMIGMYKPGTRVKVELERDKKTKSYFVSLADMNENGHADSGTLFEGLGLENLDDKYRYRLRIPDDVQGVLVTEVDPESEAAKQGIRPGDVIVQLEQKPVDSVGALSKALKKSKDELKRVYLYRYGRIFVVALK